MGYYNQQRRLHPHGSTGVVDGRNITYTHNILHEKLPYAEQVAFVYLPSDEEVANWEAEQDAQYYAREARRDPYSA
ncbi:hypothetical protein GCM10011378_41260 [Hymenobacter glacieicola]|uniref:Uncharacterized protein n=1 Tax=Hymenobacter glacieicola TaxID=1562124 RepID=A0ABQ1X5I9_9BACT|nr:hypothetical protein GCM10011378_41260 [Hymenobacter glacieicola]